MKQEIIDQTKKLLDAYYEESMQMDSEVPEEMKNGKGDLDFYGWKLIPSTITVQDIKDLEESIPFKLPTYYKAFLLSYCVLEMDFGKYRLPTKSRKCH